MEITNEGKGWHIHLHILVDAFFVPAGELAVVWGKLVGQDFAIVKVKDCRGDSYLGEVTKYVVKGSELASWPPEEIAQFIHAIRGIRFFSTFGSLFKIRKEIREEMDSDRPEPRVCSCGCSDFVYESDLASVINEVRRKSRR